jgi:hypothetical protein
VSFVLAWHALSHEKKIGFLSLVPALVCVCVCAVLPDFQYANDFTVSGDPIGLLTVAGLVTCFRVIFGELFAV